MKDFYTIIEVQGFWGMTVNKQRELCEENYIERIKRGNRLGYDRAMLEKLMKCGGWELIDGRWAYKVQDDK